MYSIFIIFKVLLFVLLGHLSIPYDYLSVVSPKYLLALRLKSLEDRLFLYPHS